MQKNIKIKFKVITHKKAFISIFAIFFSAIIISILTALYILLVKQIQLMNLDSTSFQAAYMADSALECAIYKEQNATGTKSVFRPSGTAFGNCAAAGDANWQTTPSGAPVTNSTTGHANSVLNISMKVGGEDFCGVVSASEDTRDTSSFTVTPPPNTMVISGQDRACTDTISATTKVIERVISFYY